jgi:dipeptidyl aminopeptidase/acylaminoacyl peptidase
MTRPSLTAAVLAFSSVFLFAADTWQTPPKEVLEILNSPTTPVLSLSPTRTYAMQGSPVRYPPLAELAEPMYRLAGIRINPATNGLHNATFNSTLILKKIPEGTEIPVAVPAGGRLSGASWSPDGSHFAFTNSTPAGIEIWIGETATGKTHKLPGVKLNEVFGGGGGGGGRGGGAGGSMQWMPDGKRLLVQAVRADRGAEPPAPKVPPGPVIAESLGGGRGARTYEDLLQNPHDEDLFEYYATSQLGIVDTASGAMSPIGKPAIVNSARMSPDGNYFIVTTIHRPFSYSYPARMFPQEVEIWDKSGKMLKKLSSRPLGAAGGRGGGAAAGPDDDPAAAAPASGPRNQEWQPNEPATLLWFEGTGGGGRGGGRAAAAAAPAPAAPAAATTAPATAPAHDKVLTLKAPFDGTPQVLFEIDRRLNGLLFTENPTLAIIDSGGGRGGAGGGGGGGARGGARNPTPALLVDLAHPKEAPKPLWSRISGTRYGDPGTLLEKPAPGGGRLVVLDGDNVFLRGNGPSPTGDHPFLNRYNMTTKQTTPLFKSDDSHYEAVEALLDTHGDRFLTRRESPTEPPNYFIRTAAGQLTAVTHYPDPQPIMRKVSKQLVNYRRSDGVEMSFVLYLPPDYKPGTRLPTVVWAYPREFEDADAAGEVSGSTLRFTEVTGYSEIFFALHGYAVLDNASMPIVGDRRTVNDKFVEQVIDDAKAAIDKAVDMGVTDRNRVGVGGHSYGAFMTDNLLAHSSLFKAGIAESGAPNRTLTPFGFQNERRTIWQAPETYLKMSPFMYADKLKTPLLLIHGEMDDNDGTFPIQSERMFEAVRGNGGTVRLVFLPYEAHGYRGKETIEHVLWEKFTWFDKYVRDAKPEVVAGRE